MHKCAYVVLELEEILARKWAGITGGTHSLDALLRSKQGDFFHKHKHTHNYHGDPFQKGTEWNEERQEMAPPRPPSSFRTTLTNHMLLKLLFNISY